jgi:uncharacterized protein (DUF983 family)
MSTGVPIRKFPTHLAVRCPRCGQQGVVEAFIDRPPKLKCSRCGSRDADRGDTRSHSVLVGPKAR